MTRIERTTKENLEEASGRGDRENRINEKCPESRLTANDCGRNEVNMAIFAKWTIPDKTVLLLLHY